MEEVRKLEAHLKEHPADYQAVVALYKSRSREIERKIHKRKVEKMRKIALCRRILNGK